MTFPKTDKERRALIKRLASKKLSPEEVKRGSGKLPEEFWTMPRPKISNRSSLDALLKDREEIR
ncbi:MAG: hypothetical protein AVDCRST_MAG22-1703 [uncultured Rubrobacteraceae bacterium]|uniref:Uncharacterized protein n=1 Tax=uncultured Rubrobacteraceae bacterium TaxID=349277 RepID=A0A6J4P7H2_9ACTN|nr:MAG: hypothetical protein AVDCRST_MAG22-1703 [uncultured Rubrobacteraceae bacterium]